MSKPTLRRSGRPTIKRFVAAAALVAPVLTSPFRVEGYADSQFSCIALDKASGDSKCDSNSPEHEFFFKVLRPVGFTFTWYETNTYPTHSDEEIQNARCFGLLLCAELIRDGFTAEDFK